MKTWRSLPFRPLLVISASFFLALTGGCQQVNQPSGGAAPRGGDAKDFRVRTNPGPHPVVKSVQVRTNPGPRPTYIINTAPDDERSALRTGLTVNLTLTLMPSGIGEGDNGQDNYRAPSGPLTNPKKRPDHPTIQINLPPDEPGNEKSHRPVFVSMGDDRPTGKHKGKRRAIFVHIPLDYPYPPPAERKPIPVTAD